MFPLYDSTRKTTFPIVNYIIIILNIFIYYIQLSSENFTLGNAFTPRHFNPFIISTYGPIIISMFLHGSYVHIISNLWFLHLFGDNVEDKMGHVQYALFYIFAGIAATFAQFMLSPVSLVPIIGASGAISGVAGAYFILYRNSKIKTLILKGFFITTINLPVWLFLGAWFAIQVLSGFLLHNSSTHGGVAWFAHIGGFIFGVLIALFIKQQDNFRDIIT